MLTDSQISQLHEFVKKKYVRYDDLEHELAEHLRVKIEELMSAQPSLGFEQALAKVYDTYGITGFSGYIESKMQENNNYYRSLLSKKLISFFKWPWILLVLLFIILAERAMAWWKYDHVLAVFLFGYLLMEIISGIIRKRTLNRIRKSTSGKLAVFQTYIPAAPILWFLLWILLTNQFHSSATFNNSVFLQVGVRLITAASLAYLFLYALAGWGVWKVFIDKTAEEVRKYKVTV